MTGTPGTDPVRPARRSVLAGAAGLAGALALPPGAAAAGTVSASRSALPLVSEGGPRATVRWWGDGSARLAATELRSYIRKMTGAVLPLQAAPAPKPRPPGELTGAVALVTATGPGPLPSGLLGDAAEHLDGRREDTLAVLAGPRAALLTGNGDRAPLYAVYALLEQFGVRFFAPAFPWYEGHAEHVPRRDGLSVEAQQLIDEPDWELRRLYAEEGYSHTRASLPPLIDWMAKNRLNTLVFPTDYLGLGVTTYDRVREVITEETSARGLRIESGGHGYDSFLPPGEYPEYYTSGGPLFDIDNPEALDAYVARVTSYLADRPEIGIFDCWPPDVPEFQDGIIERYGTAANAESVVVNKLTEVLAEDLPHVRVERIAYASTLDPPDADYAPDPRNLVDFAPYGRTFSVPLDDTGSAANAGLAKQLRAWRRDFRGKLSMYEYYRRYRWRSLPAHPLRTVAADAAFESGLGLDGMGMYSEPADWAPYEHLQSLVAALSWDNSLDGNGYLDGYLTARFGPAAGALRRYYEATVHDPDSYDGVRGAKKLRAAYRKAQEALKDAKGRADDEGARLVIDRLEGNIRIAVADMDIGAQSDPGSPEAWEARRVYRALVLRNRFTGAVLPAVQCRSRWLGDDAPYDDAEERRAVADAYAAPAAGFAEPGTLNLSRGERAGATVEIQDVDFTGHTVRWSAVAPGAVSVEPPSGTLEVAGTRGASREVTVTAGRGAAAGEQRITLEFRLPDGTELPAATLRLTVG